MPILQEIQNGSCAVSELLKMDDLKGSIVELPDHFCSLESYLELYSKRAELNGNEISSYRFHAKSIKKLLAEAKAISLNSVNVVFYRPDCST